MEKQRTGKILFDTEDYTKELSRLKELLNSEEVPNELRRFFKCLLDVGLPEFFVASSESTIEAGNLVTKLEVTGEWELFITALDTFVSSKRDV